MSANLENSSVVTGLVKVSFHSNPNERQCQRMFKLLYMLCWVAQSCSTLYDPRDYSLPGSSVPGDSPGKNTRVGCYALLQGNLHNPGIKPRSPALQADSLLSEPLIVLISHVSKVMLKILQARLQQYMNQDLPDVQTGFRKGRGTRGQIANIHWIIAKVKEFQKNIYFCLIWLCSSLWLCGSQQTVKFLKRWE